MFAAEYGHLDVIEVLIERGADLETKDQVLYCSALYCTVLFCTNRRSDFSFLDFEFWQNFDVTDTDSCVLIVLLFVLSAISNFLSVPSSEWRERPHVCCYQWTFKLLDVPCRQGSEFRSEELCELFYTEYRIPCLFSTSMT